MTRTKFYDDHNEIVKNRAASYVQRRGGGYQIAATALDRGLTLVTRNVTDFEPFGVSLLNPWTAP